MGLAQTIRADIFGLLLNGEAIADLAENHSSPLTDLYLSLHDGDPLGGDQSTNEVSYTDYVRVAVSRDPGSPVWTVTAGNPTVAENDNEIQFAAKGDAGSLTITHIGIGKASSGAGELLGAGEINGGSGLTINENGQPSFPAGDIELELRLPA